MSADLADGDWLDDDPDLDDDSWAAGFERGHVAGQDAERCDCPHRPDCPTLRESVWWRALLDRLVGRTP